MTTRFILPLPKPRNPLVALTRARRAGVHQRCATSRRQAQRREIARELAHERHRSP